MSWLKEMYDSRKLRTALNDAALQGDRDEVQRLIKICQQSKDGTKIIESVLSVSTQTRWHAVTRDLREALSSCAPQTPPSKEVSMGTFGRLFRSEKSGKKENQISFVNLFPVEKHMIESKTGFKEIAEYLREHSEIIVTTRSYVPVTLTISGYDNDPRELYEISEICEWAKEGIKAIPSIFYFLDEASKKRFVGWLCGPISPSEISKQEFQDKYEAKFIACSMAGLAAGEEYLIDAGATKELVELCRKSYQMYPH